MERLNFWDGKLHYRNGQLKDENGTITAVKVHGDTLFCCSFCVIEQGCKVTTSSFRPTLKDAELFMERRGYVAKPRVDGEIKTKAELFQTIRELTAAGYLFEIRNYYQGGKRDRAGYMVNILSHKSE